MRDLTSLHATMAAANKAGHPRSSRRTSGANAGQQSTLASEDADGMGIIKQEELSIGMHQRPDTSTGYEGDHNGMVYQTSANWHIQTSNMEPPRPSSRTASNTSAASNGGNHSFRDSSQSFLVPPASTPASATSASSQSFLAFSPPLSFTLPSDGSARLPNSSRPPTAGTDPSQPRSLPPLAAVVSGSLSTQSSHQQLYPTASSTASQPSQQQQQHILPFPTPSHLRRPGTGSNRPGTAPASSPLYHPSISPGAGATAAKPSYYGGPGLVSSRGEQLQLHYGRAYAADLGAGPGGYDSSPTGPESSDASPFFFQPPDTSASPPLLHNAARPYPPPPTSSGGGEYDYGSDSRPQSRRLSVMELCNDDRHGASAGVSAGAFLLSGPGGTGASRPNTSSSALAALALNDRERSPPSASSSPSTISPRAGAGEVRAYANGAHAGGGRGTPQEFAAGDGYGYGGAPGGRVSPEYRRVPPPPATAAALAASGAIFRGYASATHSPSPAPYSPQQQQPSDQPYSPTSAYGGFAPSPTFSTASAGSSAASAYGGSGGGGSPYSPRSPSYVPQSPAAAYGQQDIQYGHVHGDGSGQVRGGIRVGGHGHGHHASGPYGMRV